MLNSSFLLPRVTVFAISAFQAGRSLARTLIRNSIPLPSSAHSFARQSVVEQAYDKAMKGKNQHQHRGLYDGVKTTAEADQFIEDEYQALNDFLTKKDMAAFVVSSVSALDAATGIPSTYAPIATAAFHLTSFCMACDAVAQSGKSAPPKNHHFGNDYRTKRLT